MINKLTIVGIGLIGDSLARALRRVGYVNEIVGFGRNLNNLKLAVDLGVVDHAEVNLAAATKDADMIVIAVPVGAMTEIFSQLAGRITRETVVTDVGSVKTSVVTMAREALGAAEFARFVPGHPIAGTEESGVAASREDLFQSHQIILSPEPETDPGAVETVRAMWEAAGATVRMIEAPQHDIILAASSHLPHVLAYALVDLYVFVGDALRFLEHGRAHVLDGAAHEFAQGLLVDVGELVDVEAGLAGLDLAQPGQERFVPVKAVHDIERQAALAG